MKHSKEGNALRPD